jgi:hypothetical protein
MINCYSVYTMQHDFCNQEIKLKGDTPAIVSDRGMVSLYVVSSWANGHFV